MLFVSLIYVLKKKIIKKYILNLKAGLKIYKHIINVGGIKNILVICHNFFKANCLLTHLALHTNFILKNLGSSPAIRANISLRKYDKSSISLSKAGLFHFYCKKCVSRWK